MLRYCLCVVEVLMPSLLCVYLELVRHFVFWLGDASVLVYCFFGDSDALPDV